MPFCSHFLLSGPPRRPPLLATMGDPRPEAAGDFHWALRHSKRQMALHLLKHSEAYRLLEEVRSWGAGAPGPYEPQTPDATSRCSKRAWETDIHNWRQELKAWAEWFHDRSTTSLGKVPVSLARHLGPSAQDKNPQSQRKRRTHRGRRACYKTGQFGSPDR